MSSRILVVDDEFDYRHLVHLAFEDTEMEVIEASNGAEALTMIQEKKPDMVLLDINMPGMDGFAVCKKIRKDPVFKHVPIIMLTVRTSVPSQSKGLTIGADDYILKPFDPEELRGRVKAVLQRSR